jgi:LPXTG-site transpeptidase (sortase) family protein
MALKINRTITKITRIVGWGLTIAILVCFAKVFFWEKAYYKEQTIMARSKSQSVITKLPPLDGLIDQEITKDEYDKFQVEAKAPRYIRIPRTSLNTIVRGKSLSSNGALQISSNINETAWYSGTSNPGDDGTIVIAGISSYYGESGAFHGLDSLEKGDEIELESGDGNIYKYAVESINITSIKDSAKVLPTTQQRREGKETLSLISISDGSESFVLIRATKQ